MKRSILAAILLATTAGGVAVWQVPALAQAAMGTKSGVDQALIDHSVKPGDDFNAYANGIWLKTAEIPADRSSIGVGLDVFKVAEARNADIIQNAAKANAKPGTDLRRIADYYAAYDNTAAIEAREFVQGKSSLEKFRNAYKGDPVYGAHYAYDAVFVLVSAMQRSRTVDGEKLTAELKRSGLHVQTLEPALAHVLGLASAADPLLALPPERRRR